MLYSDEQHNLTGTRCTDAANALAMLMLMLVQITLWMFRPFPLAWREGWVFLISVFVGRCISDW